MNALSLWAQSEAPADGAWWGRLVENAVGDHVLNGLQGPGWSVTCWREGDREVDFILTARPAHLRP